MLTAEHTVQSGRGEWDSSIVVSQILVSGVLLSHPRRCLQAEVCIHKNAGLEVWLPACLLLGKARGLEGHPTQQEVSLNPLFILLPYFYLSLCGHLQAQIFFISVSSQGIFSLNHSDQFSILISEMKTLLSKSLIITILQNQKDVFPFSSHSSSQKNSAQFSIPSF